MPKSKLLCRRKVHPVDLDAFFEKCFPDRVDVGTETAEGARFAQAVAKVFAEACNGLDEGIFKGGLGYPAWLRPCLVVLCNPNTGGT